MNNVTFEIINILGDIRLLEESETKNIWDFSFRKMRVLGLANKETCFSSTNLFNEIKEYAKTNYNISLENIDYALLMLLHFLLIKEVSVHLKKQPSNILKKLKFGLNLKDNVYKFVLNYDKVMNENFKNVDEIFKKFIFIMFTLSKHNSSGTIENMEAMLEEFKIKVNIVDIFLYTILIKNFKNSFDAIDGLDDFLAKFKMEKSKESFYIIADEILNNVLL